MFNYIIIFKKYYEVSFRFASKSFRGLRLVPSRDLLHGHVVFIELHYQRRHHHTSRSKPNHLQTLCGLGSRQSHISVSGGKHFRQVHFQWVQSHALGLVDGDSPGQLQRHLDTRAVAS